MEGEGQSSGQERRERTSEIEGMGRKKARASMCIHPRRWKEGHVSEMVIERAHVNMQPWHYECR